MPVFTSASNWLNVGATRFGGEESFREGKCCRRRDKYWHMIYGYKYWRSLVSAAERIVESEWLEPDVRKYVLALLLPFSSLFSAIACNEIFLLWFQKFPEFHLRTRTSRNFCEIHTIEYRLLRYILLFLNISISQIFIYRVFRLAANCRIPYE